MQHRIVTPGPLHDENGRLIETGYATSLIKTYDRSRIAARPWRIKEWDYYAVCCDRFALALTIDHNGYMTMDSISLLDFETNSQVTTSRINLPAFAKRSLPPTSVKGDIRVSGKDYAMAFDNDGTVRHLHGHMDHFPNEDGITCDLTLTDAPAESDPDRRPGGIHGHRHALQGSSGSLLLQPEDQLHAGLREYNVQRKGVRLYSGGHLCRAGLGPGRLDL